VEGNQRKHILFLGLDHRLLWQLTRTLAHLEDQITIDCVKDPSAAKEICDREVVHVIVVDGWEQARQAAHHLAGDEAFEGKPWKWIILVEALPLEGLPAGRCSPSALFLEKPFNPKDFPSFLWGVLEEKGIREEEQAPPPVSEEISLPLVAGETYQEPVAPPRVDEGVEAEAGAEIQRAEIAHEPVEPPDFYRHLDQGFACLSVRDWKGAKEHWLEALRIRPDDQRLSANLRRLQRMTEERGEPE
jgi:hypothetical protein